MEILSSVSVKPDYTTNAFVKKHFSGYALSTPMHHKELANILDNRKLIPAMQQIMARPWRGMPGLISHQKTLIELADDDFANILLIQSKTGDRLCLMIMGNKKVMEDIVISYVGSESVFESYLKDLNIPPLAVYSNIILNPEE